MPDVYTRHKPIRNKIRKYEPLSIITTGIHILQSGIDSAQDPTGWRLGQGAHFPWHILLLIRWTFQYAEYKSNLKKITVPEFLRLCDLIYDLNNRTVLENQKREMGIDSFIKRIAFYQLPFQVRKYEIKSSFCRQIIMFQDMGEAHNLSSDFKSIAGISLNDFYYLYYCYLFTIEGARSARAKLSISYFRNKFPIEVIQKFFSLLSLDFYEAKCFIRNHTAGADIRKWIDYQLNEHTPLERYPFFQIGGKFIHYSARLLDNSLMYNAYDIFKEHNPNFSRDAFGQIFEDYIAKGVEYTCNEYLREQQIKALLPKGSKAADFLIKESQASVIIDAKSTELHPIPRVLQSKDSMVKNLESTIINGVLQIITTAYYLRKSGKINENDTIFGLIVTFKDYIIGDGKIFWDDIISETVEEKLEKLGIKNPISPENIFYISIADFDYLMAGAKAKSLPVSQILSDAVEKNRSPETAALMLKQHLEVLWGEYFCPEYVANRGNECLMLWQRNFLSD